MLRYKYRKIFMTIIISLLLTGCANQQSENVSVVKRESPPGSSTGVLMWTMTGPGGTRWFPPTCPGCWVNK